MVRTSFQHAFRVSEDGFDGSLVATDGSIDHFVRIRNSSPFFFLDDFRAFYRLIRVWYDLVSYHMRIVWNQVRAILDKSLENFYRVSRNGDIELEEVAHP
jgi:hypothetical protein